MDIIPILDRHRLGHVIDFVNTNQSGRELEHVISQRNDNELGVLSAFFDVGGYDGDLFQFSCVLIFSRFGVRSSYISEIQGSINLIHDIQRRRLIVMQREHQGQTTQRLLTTRKIGDVLP